MARVNLCGVLGIELDGARVEAELPGRQGRLSFAFLLLGRDRGVMRMVLGDDPGRLPGRSKPSRTQDTRGASAARSRNHTRRP
jgi:hypothetical protein